MLLHVTTSLAVPLFEMTTCLEFLNTMGNEAIAAPIEHFDGPVPTAGDTVYLDLPERFRVVRRVFYYYPIKPGSLTAFGLDMKVSLHCERLPEGSFY